MGESHSVDIGRFEATLREIELSMGLNVDSIRIHGTSLKLLTDPLKAIAERPAQVEIIVLESAITDLLSKNPPMGLKNIRVKFHEGKIRLEAIKTVLVDLKVTAVCALRIHEQTQVFLDLESLEMMGAGLKQMAQAHLDKLNPLIDASQLPVPATLHRFELSSGKLTVWGDVSPPV